MIADAMHRDPYKALLHIRNSLAHGTTQVHMPGMALAVITRCADAVNEIFAPQAA